MTVLRDALEILTSGSVLEPSHFRDVLDGILEGAYSEIQIAGFLTAFSCVPLTKGNLLEAVTLLRSKMVTVSAPDGVVDCCGTGGDAPQTGGSVNISTAVAFFAAEAGLTVAKHGNRSVSSKSGSADVLEALGYNIEKDPMILSKTLRDTNLCFLFAPYFHPALKYVGAVRKELKIKTFFNILGPLLNPASVKKQLIGVYDFSLAPIITEVLRETGTETAMIVRSYEGADELTLAGENDYMLLENGNITTGKINPVDYGFAPSDSSDLRGGDAAFNAKAMQDIFNGTMNAYRDIVDLNLAALLRVSGKIDNFNDAAHYAKTISSVELGKYIKR